MILDKVYIYYTTCGSKKSAEILAKKLIKNKKAICVNIIRNVKSFYEENKKIKNSNELILIIKSLNKKKEIREFILKKHDYETPFITQIKNVGVNKEYRRWAKFNK